MVKNVEKPRLKHYQRSKVLKLLHKCHCEAILTVSQKLAEFRSFLLGTTMATLAENPLILTFLNETIDAIEGTAKRTKDEET